MADKKKQTDKVRPIKIALAGNPNSGKTTLFNALTGGRQHVGNYPGVTVEKKEGSFRQDGIEVQVIDLPGAYSLTANSPEELVARNVVLEEVPDLLVDVVDASNLERNMYLATQYMELGVPMLLALNMSDLAEARGHRVDIARLEALLNIPILRLVANKGQGIAELKQAIMHAATSPEPRIPAKLKYGREIESELGKLSKMLTEGMPSAGPVRSRWIALKLLEQDEVVAEQLPANAQNSEAILREAEAARHRLEQHAGDDAEILIADRRYGFISGALHESIQSTPEARQSMSDRIDMVMTHRVLSLPIFMLLMFLVFQLTFTIGEPFMSIIETLFSWLGEALANTWPEGRAELLRSLLADGVIGGVGGVLVFLPNILLLFLAIAFLEDSGYMARAAFIMDRFMHKIGLHGKSFIPMLIGFGCTVPAIMATRTLENRRDRLTTMLVAPLMSCGARLPIYLLIIPAFFPSAWHARMLWIIYIIGIVLAVICAKILRSTLFRGETAAFVMELPPYRLPTLRGVCVHMWERSWLYLKKAGTIILAISIVMWALATFPQKEEFSEDYDAQIEVIQAAENLDDEAKAERIAEIGYNIQSEELAHTFAGRIGHALEPIIRPLGFDWRIGTALIGSFAAKEVFVAQMGIVYAVGEADENSDTLREKLQAHYTPLQAFCIMLFCLISTPCMATIVITRRESNSWGWALFQLSGLTVLAYVLTMITYQVGTMLGIGV